MRTDIGLVCLDQFGCVFDDQQVLGVLLFSGLGEIEGYPLKAGQLEYDCRYSKMHGMPVTGSRGFRGLKLLWYNGVPP